MFRFKPYLGGECNADTLSWTHATLLIASGGTSCRLAAWTSLICAPSCLGMRYRNKLNVQDWVLSLRWMQHRLYWLRKLFKLEVLNLLMNEYRLCGFYDYIPFSVCHFIEIVPWEDIVHEKCGGPVKILGQMAKRSSPYSPLRYYQYHRNNSFKRTNFVRLSHPGEPSGTISSHCLISLNDKISPKNNLWAESQFL